MLRMFKQHTVRRQRELDGLWRFRTLSDEGEHGEERHVIVPSCWETLRGLEDYRGRGVYSLDVETKGEFIRLVFKGVSHTADIYWDGKHVGHHYNAYTPFDIVLSGITRGSHRLEVVADNRYSEDSALHVPNDYRSYGGITRPVAIEELSGRYIKQLHAQPIYHPERGGWDLKISAAVEFLDGVNRSGKTVLRGQIDGQSFFIGEFLPGGPETAECVIHIGNAVCWSNDNPVLYPLTAELADETGKIIDDLSERVGFRSITVEGDKILLNGQRIYLKGFNRHEDYAQFGCAVPVHLMQYDIEIIRSTGANMIRTSHYPNDERFLDLCDAQGIFVWEEAHARGLSIDQVKNPNFIKQSADCIREMVNAHYNHPCIIMWGMLNECPSHDPYGRERYAEQLQLLRSLDPYRPLTFASDKHDSDLCLDLVDIISFNIYPQWYTADTPEAFASRLLEYAERHGGAPDGKVKPMLISEFGAGAIAGHRGFSNLKWTEERQAAILKDCIESMSRLPFLSGLIIWQFADCRVDEEWSMVRPKTQNNKGIVDTYRLPKLSYYAVCECFTHLWKQESK